MSGGEPVTSSNSTAARIRDRIYSLKTTIAHRIPFKRQSVQRPPTLPSRDFLEQGPDAYSLCDDVGQQTQLDKPAESTPTPKVDSTAAPSGDDQATSEPLDNCQAVSVLTLRHLHVT